ncbi:MAG: fibronectin type III domain-containing protein, partial [Lentisphaeria bacterium]
KNEPEKIVIKVPFQRVISDVKNIVTANETLNLLHTKVNLAWFHPQGATPHEYEVEYWSDEDAKLNAKTQQNYINLNLPQSAKKYFWRVRAKNKFGVGLWSEIAEVEIIALNSLETRSE